MLIVMKDRDIQLLLETGFDLEASGGGNIL